MFISTKAVQFLRMRCMQFIQGANRHQTYFTTLEEAVAVDNPVWLIDVFVDKLDLQELCFNLTKLKAEGRPPFAPAVLLKLYLYGYLNKIRSSRKLERECSRNVELQWLLQGLKPNYHSIADFRKENARGLKNMFRLYVQFLGEAGLLGKTIVAVDGSKFRAVNSKKNNYNQNKIDKYSRWIEEKTEAYLTQLDTLDAAENKTTEEFKIQASKIKEGLQKLKERKIKYDLLQEQLDATSDRQVSTTDPDSRSILVTKAIVEVAYNVQNAVDDKYNLIVHTEATNTNDGNLSRPFAIVWTHFCVQSILAC